MSVSLERGSEQSHSERSSSVSGPVLEKKRHRLDSGDKRSKKSFNASASWGRAMRTVAVVPSRRMRRPNSGESWYGSGT